MEGYDGMGESDAIGGMRCDTISYCPSGTSCCPSGTSCCQGTADNWSCCCPYPMVTITISLVSLWSHINATQGPRSRFDVVVNVYGPVSGSSERTNHSPCGGYNFSEVVAVDARRVRKVRNPLALRQRGTIISPLGWLWKAPYVKWLHMIHRPTDGKQLVCKTIKGLQTWHLLLLCHKFWWETRKQPKSKNVVGLHNCFIFYPLKYF